jgi:hypothetical protein
MGEELAFGRTGFDGVLAGDLEFMRALGNASFEAGVELGEVLIREMEFAGFRLQQTLGLQSGTALPVKTTGKQNGICGRMLLGDHAEG